MGKFSSVYSSKVIAIELTPASISQTFDVIFNGVHMKKAKENDR